MCLHGEAGIPASAASRSRSMPVDEDGRTRAGGRKQEEDELDGGVPRLQEGAGQL